MSRPEQAAAFDLAMLNGMVPRFWTSMRYPDELRFLKFKNSVAGLSGPVNYHPDRSEIVIPTGGSTTVDFQVAPNVVYEYIVTDRPEGFGESAKATVRVNARYWIEINGKKKVKGMGIYHEQGQGTQIKVPCFLQLFPSADHQQLPQGYSKKNRRFTVTRGRYIRFRVQDDKEDTYEVYLADNVPSANRTEGAFLQLSSFYRVPPSSSMLIYKMQFEHTD